MNPPIVFLGSPDEAVPPLRALHAAGHNIVLVVTQPDARRGRRGKETPTPVKTAALDLGIPVAHELDSIDASAAKMGVVVAYGRIIPGDLLDRVPMLNIHFSKLPRWRGAAPVERAILAGDAETGVAIMQMEAGLDTGPIHAEEIVRIDPDDTAESLRGRLVEIGTNLLLRTLFEGLRDDPRPQEGQTVYASKITSEDRAINWSESAERIHRVIRVGRAHTTFRGDRFVIWSAKVRTASPSSVDREPGTLRSGRVDSDATGGPFVSTIDRDFELLEVQPAGKPRMEASAWWNGAQADGEVLGR